MTDAQEQMDKIIRIQELEESLAEARQSADYWMQRHNALKDKLDAYESAFALVRDLAKLVAR